MPLDEIAAKFIVRGYAEVLPIKFEPDPKKDAAQ